MDQEEDVHQDIVQLVISTMNEMAEDGEGPSFQEMIERRIAGYAAFAKELIFSESATQVPTIIRAHEDAKKLNDKIQQYVKLADRGLVTIRPADIIQEYIFHPRVQVVSDEGSAKLILEWETETIPSDFLEIVDRIVLGAAAAQLLGGITFWLEPTEPTATNYALVHSLSSTKH